MCNLDDCVFRTQLPRLFIVRHVQAQAACLVHWPLPALQINAPVASIYSKQQRETFCTSPVLSLGIFDLRSSESFTTTFCIVGVCRTPNSMVIKSSSRFVQKAERCLDKSMRHRVRREKNHGSICLVLFRAPNLAEVVMHGVISHERCDTSCRRSRVKCSDVQICSSCNAREG